jgi:hypothetical protein
MMEAVRTSETSVYFNETTWRYILEGSHLRESLDGLKFQVLSVPKVWFIEFGLLRDITERNKSILQKIQNIKRSL